MSNKGATYSLIFSSLIFYSGNAGAAKTPTIDATIRSVVRQEMEAYHKQQEQALLKNVETAWNIVVPNKTVLTFNNPISGLEETIEGEGTGFVVGDKYITLDHVTSLYEKEIDGPLGPITMPIERLEEKTYINDIELTPVIESPETDIAVFQLPKELCQKYCNEGVNISSELYVGLDVFWIGNPGNSGKVLRYGKIGRIDLPADIPLEGVDSAIGLNTYVIPGDSGSPVFNTKGELLGVVQFSQSFSGGSLGFFKPIDPFLPYLTSTTSADPAANE